MPIATPSRKWSFAYHESHILTWRLPKRQVGMAYECWLLQAAGNCWCHTNAATDSIAKLPLIPGQSCHRFQAKAAADSTAKLPPMGRGAETMPGEPLGILHLSLPQREE